MKFIHLAFITFLGISLLNPVYALQGDKRSDEAILNNIDATQAMEIANRWKWSKKNVKTYVTPREVVFKFSHGTVKKIPLPEEKMVVAIAPYIKRTHK
jgi:hypothetical protein